MFNIVDLNGSLLAVGTKAKAVATSAMAEATFTAAGTFTSIKNVLACHACNPECWKCIFPHLTQCTGTLQVCDTSSFKRCGASCTWTVPSGVSFAKFEIWGPGAQGGAGMCCGGAPFGATGAYATTIIPVTPGCQYVLTAGCADANRLCCTLNATYQGSPSSVTGYGLTNFCANGGCHNLIRRMCQQRTQLCGTSMCCRWQNPTCTSSGGCICGTSYYCNDNSCATCGCIPVFNDTEVTFYGTPFGHNSIHGATCMDTNIYGFHIHPPLVSPVDGKSQVACCCLVFNNGQTCNPFYQAACCGATNSQNGTPIWTFPGMGGTASVAFGGCTSLCGDWGRMGMVKVSWC
jgi:hypothetical protein